MLSRSQWSPHATSIRHHDRGLTLVFGSDGQVSLIGFDSGLASQVPYTLTAGYTGALTPATPSFPRESTFVSPIPNLEASSVSFTGSFPTPTPTPTPTSIRSSLTASSYDPSSTATNTDTNLPSIPTVDYPTPSPTPVSNPKDHGVGAPFYLAIVLASISFIGCVAAFIAWWIRSRSRRRDLELDDPWSHRDTLSDAGSPFTDNSHAFEKGTQPRAETQTRPYYLPASIVRRTSSNLLAVPHTIPTLEDGTLQNGTSRTTIDPGLYSSLHRASGPRPQNSSSGPDLYQNVPSSQITSSYSRPGVKRLQTGLSVQESTRTLGRLRVANRVPGDITSGDEGGMNLPRLRDSAGPSSAANPDRLDAAPVGENTTKNDHSDQNGRFVQGGDGPLEPPGPATLPWGRRTDTIAALRRTRRGGPGTSAQTYKNASYSGYLYPTLDGGPSDAMRHTPTTINQEENERVHVNLQHDSLGWTNTLKSSFWQAVDAVTGNRPLDSEPRIANAGNGSGFTPAPQRVAPRRSPISPIRLSTSSTLPDTCAIRSQETEAKYDPTLLDKPVATKEISENSTHLNFGDPSTKRNEAEAPGNDEVPLERGGSIAPRVSRLNHDLSASAHRRHPDSLRTDTGSVYSTESTAARANLRKYGYGDSIPSTWSALGATRESQLDLARMYLPLPRLISSSPRPLSVTPSQLTLESGLLSSSMSTRTRTYTPMQSENDLIGSDAGTVQSGRRANAAIYGETNSVYTMSRNGTMQSGRGTIGHDTVPSHALSTASSLLSRKKGVTTRRKRPRLPRAPSSASSVPSMEGGLSIKEAAVRRALLDRRKKVKAAESLKGREDSLTRSHDASLV